MVLSCVHDVRVACHPALDVLTAASHHGHGRGTLWLHAVVAQMSGCSSTTSIGKNSRVVKELLHWAADRRHRSRPVAALQRLGRLQLVLRARTARRGGEEWQAAAYACWLGARPSRAGRGDRIDSVWT